MGSALRYDAPIMPAADSLTNRSSQLDAETTSKLAQQIKNWGKEIGFDEIGIADVDLVEHERHLDNWLQLGRHGEMDYMHKHGSKRKPGRR